MLHCAKNHSLRWRTLNGRDARSPSVPILAVAKELERLEEDARHLLSDAHLGELYGAQGPFAHRAGAERGGEDRPAALLCRVLDAAADAGVERIVRVRHDHSELLRRLRLGEVGEERAVAGASLDELLVQQVPHRGLHSRPRNGKAPHKHPVARKLASIVELSVKNLLTEPFADFAARWFQLTKRR